MTKVLRRTVLGALLTAIAVMVCHAFAAPTARGLGTIRNWAAKACAASAKLRHPVALALADNGRWLLTANERSGTISVIDTTSLKLIGETAVGKSFADLTTTPDGRHLLALDAEANELVVLIRQGSDLAIVGRVVVPIGPVKVRTAADGSHCYVASLWARKLTVIDLRPVLASATGTPGGSHRERARAPRAQYPRAGAFGRREAPARLPSSAPSSCDHLARRHSLGQPDDEPSPRHSHDRCAERRCRFAGRRHLRSAWGSYAWRRRSGGPRSGGK